MYDRSHGHGETEILGAGTDLFLSLFSVMVCVYALMVGLQAATQEAAKRVQSEKAETDTAHASLLLEHSELMDALTGIEQENKMLKQDTASMTVSLGESRYESVSLREQVEALLRSLASRSDSEARLSDALLSLQRERDGAFARLEDERLIRQDLLGLRGDLDKVVFVVDRSASMQHGERWEQARQIIEKWMMHLPVNDAALIVFNQVAYCYPRNKTFLKLHDQNRRQLIERLRRFQPAGKTRTLKALKAAYAFEGVDTIMLFTDGKPSDSNEAIFEFIKAHQAQGVVINAIALGSYADKRETFEFLTAIAEKTGGSYRGR